MERSNRSVSSDNGSPVKSFSLVVDLSKVTKLSMYSCYLPSLDRITSDRLIDLLKQTPNLQSLTIDWRSNGKDDPFVVEKVGFRIIGFLDPSKFRHLNIPIFNLGQIKMILDRFANIFSLTLCLSTGSISAAEIFDYFRTSWPDCSMVKDQDSISIWLDDRSKKKDRKHLKLSH